MAGKAAVDETAQVLSVDRGRGSSVRALLSAPQIAGAAKPMQFVMVKVRLGLEPFLRRPFSLSHIDAAAGIIGITWDVIGRGTEIMAGWEPGQEVLLLGPLGNGLTLPRPESKNHLYLMAGGTGLAPILPVAQAAMAGGWEPQVFYGARSHGLLLDYGPLEDLGCRVEISTDDGSFGTKTFVTELARPALLSAGPGDIAVSCGSTLMTRAAKKMCAEAGVTLYVSLEARMACGTGLCKGCAVKSAKSEGYFHVCSDGPVFLAEDVLLGGESQ